MNDVDVQVPKPPKIKIIKEDIPLIDKILLILFSIFGVGAILYLLIYKLISFYNLNF